MKSRVTGTITGLIAAILIAGCATDWTSIFQPGGSTPTTTTGGSSTEISQLLPKLKSSDEQTVITAVRRLGNIDNGSTEVLNEFRDLLSAPDRSAAVKVEVLDAAYAYDRRAPLLPGLAVCLKNPDEDVRIDACDMIADIEKPLSVDILIDNLDNPYEDMRESCQDYLEFITDKEFTTKAQWKSWWDRSKATFKF